MRDAEQAVRAARTSAELAAAEERRRQVEQRRAWAGDSSEHDMDRDIEAGIERDGPSMGM